MIKYILFSFLLIIAQAYIPKIWLFSEFDMTIDFFLIFLTFLVLNKTIYLIVVYAFILGLFQDFVIQIKMIGAYALIKPFAVYFIGILKSFNHLWLSLNKMIYLYTIYFLHFLIYYYIMVNHTIYIILILTFVQSLICFILFYVIEKYFFKTDYF